MLSSVCVSVEADDRQGCLALMPLRIGCVPAGPMTQISVAYCEELSVKLNTGGMGEEQV